jgi:hypothetical protein
MLLDFTTITKLVAIILFLVSAIIFFSNAFLDWGFAGLGVAALLVGQFRTKK